MPIPFKGSALLTACLLTTAVAVSAESVDSNEGRLALRWTWLSRDNYTLNPYQRVGGHGNHLGIDLQLHSQGSRRGLTTTPNWTVEMQNLGLPALAARFSLDTLDSLALNISYREITQQHNNAGLTPFTGTDHLVLPAHWRSSSRSEDFNPELFTQPLNPALMRRNLRLDLSQPIMAGWKVNAQVELERKTGTRLTGMAIYTNAANPHGALLPTPVDQASLIYGLKVEYTGTGSVFSLGYNFNRFDNHYHRLTWQNPFLSGLGPGFDYPDGTGSYASAPDTDSHQWLLSAGRQLTHNIRISLDGSATKTRQNDDLVQAAEAGFSPPEARLPLTRLNGGLANNTLSLALQIQPLQRVAVNFRYGFRQRENTLDRLAWPLLRGDGSDSTDTDPTIYNRPLNLEQDSYRVDVNWRAKNRSRIQLRYDYLRTARNYASVNITREDRYALTVQLPASARVKHRLSLTRVDLAGSTYEWSRAFFQTLNIHLINQLPNNQRFANHPLLRQYSLANQEKTGIDWLTSYQPTTAWTLHFKGETQFVNFDKSELGLTDVHDTHFNLSTNYQHSVRLNSSGWIDYRVQQRRQTGRDFLGGINKPANIRTPPYPQGSDPTRNYETDQSNATIGVGASVEWQFSERLSLSFDYSWLHDEETFGLETAGARDLEGSDLPTIINRLHSIKSLLRFEPRQALQLTLEHQYLRLADNNWQWQNVSLDTLSRVLGTGQRNPNDLVHQLTLGLHYRF